MCQVFQNSNSINELEGASFSLHPFLCQRTGLRMLSIGSNRPQAKPRSVLSSLTSQSGLRKSLLLYGTQYEGLHRAPTRREMGGGRRCIAATQNVWGKTWRVEITGYPCSRVERLHALSRKCQPAILDMKRKDNPVSSHHWTGKPLRQPHRA